MFDKLKQVVAAVAPTIATALGGPLAGMAVAALGNALGVNTSDPEQLTQAFLQASPDQILAIKKQDQDFKLEVLRINTQDTIDARSREVQLSNTKWGWMSLSVQNFGALVIIFIMIAMTAWALFGSNIDPQNLSQIINTNYNIILLLVGYWWGKSKRED